LLSDPRIASLAAWRCFKVRGNYDNCAPACIEKLVHVRENTTQVSVSMV